MILKWPCLAIISELKDTAKASRGRLKRQFGNQLYWLSYIVFGRSWNIIMLSCASSSATESTLALTLWTLMVPQSE